MLTWPCIDLSKRDPAVLVPRLLIEFEGPNLRWRWLRLATLITCYGRGNEESMAVVGWLVPRIVQFLVALLDPVVLLMQHFGQLVGRVDDQDHESSEAEDGSGKSSVLVFAIWQSDV